MPVIKITLRWFIAAMVSGIGWGLVVMLIWGAAKNNLSLSWTIVSAFLINCLFRRDKQYD